MREQWVEGDFLDLRDTFTKGFLAGLIGGVTTTIVGLLFNFLKLSTLFFADFSAILIYGHRPKGLLKLLFAMLVHWGFESAGGVVFIFLLKAISTKNLFLKGCFSASASGFSPMSLPHFLKLRGLVEISLKNAFTNFLISSIYGLSLAWAYAYIEQHIEKAEV